MGQPSPAEAKKIAVTTLLDEVQKSHGNDNCVAAAQLLTEIHAAHITHLNSVRFVGLQHIALLGDKAKLFLIRSGNALIHLPLSVTMTAWREMVQRDGAKRSELETFGHVHPIILSEWDFIGEFEIWGRSTFMASVVSGLPFRIIGKSKTLLETEIIEIPPEPAIQSPTLKEAFFTQIRAKVRALNSLLLVALSQEESQIKLRRLIPFFFGGVLPVFKGFYKDRSKALRVHEFGNGNAMGKLARTSKLRGIEVSTKHLELLGIPDVGKVLNSFVTARGTPDNFYWKRLNDEHPRFNQSSDGEGYKPAGPDGVLIFLDKDCETNTFCDSDGF